MSGIESAFFGALGRDAERKTSKSVREYLRHLDVEWSPAFPHIKKHRAFRKFVTAYQAVRREFYADIAAIVGGNVLIIDTDLVTIDGMEVITMPRKH